MGDGIYLAGAGMVAGQVRQEALVHNLANVTTPGYKASRVFADVLDDVGRTVGSMRAAERNQKMYIDFSQGLTQRTDRELDFALEGDGFFVVQTPEGERFTRNGNFSLSSDGRLVTQSGLPVLVEGATMDLSEGKLVVNKAGEMFLDDEPVGRLTVRTVEPVENLVREGMGLFGPRPGTGLRDSPSAAGVSQGYLEGSNVLALDEMIRMMTQFRQYEACQRMVQMQHASLAQLVNDLVQS